MALGRSSSDEIVIKAPADRRLYRVLHLPNGLTAVLVHDPEIFPENPSKDPPTLENEEEEEEDDDDDDDDEDNDNDEEEDYDDEDDDDGDADADEDEEHEKKKGGVIPTKKDEKIAISYLGLPLFIEKASKKLWDPIIERIERNIFFSPENYLSKHGGSSNAYTETEYTCYYFEVNREFLKGALERFSQFFVSPLIKAEAMEREVLAVDSEFNQVLQSDACRLQQLQCHTSSPGHPFNRFFWGNKKSLSDAMEKGVNLREQIFRLYEENYHGGLMRLVVIGGEPLDILEDWVMGLFSDIKEGLQSKADVRKDLPIWKAGKLYRLEAVKDVNSLNLTWTLPCLSKEYLKKPEDYLAHILGHEGKGSLHFFLKAKGWATSLSAGVGDEGMHRSSIAYIFVMSIYLTESGLDNVHEIIGVVYQYLELMRKAGPQAWIFKELQDIGNMEFKFVEEQPQDDYAAELAANLHFYSEEHIIYGDYAFEVWDEKLIKHVLSFFSPENMRVDIMSKSFDKQSKDVQYEPWFGSLYTEEDISPSLLELWKNPSKIDPSLYLPPKNEFIPCDFSIRSANTLKDPSIVDLPKCIDNQPLVKLWYKADWIFNVPRANTYFLITVKEGYNSVRNCVLTELFVNLLKDELNEVLYQAGVAKLETSLSIIGDKLELKIYGFNDKLQNLLFEILTVSKSFSPTADRFKVIKEDMERSLRNANLKPLNHSSYLRLQVLREFFWDVDEKLSCLSNLSLSDLKAFIPILLSQLHIEGLCHGNLSVDEAISISNTFRSILSVQPLPMEIRHQEHVLCLPSGANLVRNACVKNKLEVNSVVEIYFQIEQDTGMNWTKLRAITDLFDDIVEEPFFDQLRTKEQLGYVVDCGPRMTYRALGFCFRVQSSKYDPFYLHGRIDHFINGLQELLDGIDDKSFENYRKGLIEKKLEKDPSLTYETNNHWNQIVDKRYLFDMSKLEAEELKHIEKSDVIDWYKTYLRSPSPKCRQLAIHVWGCNTDMKIEGEMEAKFGKEIEDLVTLKKLTGFYPSLC